MDQRMKAQLGGDHVNTEGESLESLGSARIDHGRGHGREEGPAPIGAPRPQQHQQTGHGLLRAAPPPIDPAESSTPFPSSDDSGSRMQDVGTTEGRQALRESMRRRLADMEARRNNAYETDPCLLPPPGGLAPGAAAVPFPEAGSARHGDPGPSAPSGHGVSVSEDVVGIREPPPPQHHDYPPLAGPSGSPPGNPKPLQSLSRDERRDLIDQIMTRYNIDPENVATTQGGGGPQQVHSTVRNQHSQGGLLQDEMKRRHPPPSAVLHPAACCALACVSIISTGNCELMVTDST